MKKEKNEISKDETEPIEQNEIAQDEDPPCGLPLPCTQSISSTGPAISIENTATSGPADGVQGISHSPYASGVFGNNLATGGFANGVFGASTSPDGRGVDGLASHPTGPNFGVRGQSNSTNGRGVFGLATATDGPADGVFGESGSKVGFGVHGVNRSEPGPEGINGGVLGEGSVGVLGRSGNNGVRGEGSVGVLGQGDNTGVYGICTTSGGEGGYGGYFRGGGRALYAEGIAEVVGDLIYSGRLNKLDVADNFTAVVRCADFTMGHSSRRGSHGLDPGRALVDSEDGSLTINFGGDWSATRVDSDLVVRGAVKASSVTTAILFAGAKFFKIDHPVDPANKYLTHACVESAEMMNVYTGNIVLDTNGEAWVELPEWFETLNRDFRYQLTPIGAPAPNLYIVQEIEGNRFKIAGGDPGSKVSWQVTGIRRDPFAEKYPISVEEEKLAEERGYYLHPEVFGQPKEKGIEWTRHPK